MKKLILGMMVIMGTLSFGREHDRQGNKLVQYQYNNNIKQEQQVERMTRENTVGRDKVSIDMADTLFFRDRNNDR